MKPLRYLVWVALCLLSVAVAAAQELTCPDIVQQALAATDAACSDVGRNQACYGNINLEAIPQEGISFEFSQPGDLVDVAGVQTLALSPLDEQAAIWGVAVMKVQANLPDTLPGQNVTFLLFGDVEITNAVTPGGVEDVADAPAGVTLDVTVNSVAPLMASLTDMSQMPEMLDAGTTAIANGREFTGQMVHIQLEDGRSGWTLIAMVDIDGDISTLPEIDLMSEITGEVAPSEPELNPMQAFYFKSGLNDAPCAEAPDSGILIQTPEGQGKISLTVNGAEIQLGSTAYVQAQPGEDMTVSVVEGQGIVTADGETVVVPAGMMTTLPLDENLEADGPPTEPEPYDDSRLGVLPVNSLPRTFTIAPPLEAVEVVPGEPITPLAGQWTSTTVDVTASSACPAIMVQAISSAGIMGSSSDFTMPAGEFDLERIWRENGEIPAGFAVTREDANHYHVVFSEEGTTGNYDFVLVSPSEMNATFSIVIEGGCELTMTYEMYYTGG